MRMMHTRIISAVEALELRTHVLRPGQWPTPEIYLEDEHPTTTHFAHYLDHNIVGVATFILTPPPTSLRNLFDVDTDFIRLRGMGIDTNFHRRGYGATLLNFAIADYQRAFPSNSLVLWFNARESALPFYQSLDCKIHGGFFDIPNIGPHKNMWRRLK